MDEEAKFDIAQKLLRDMTGYTEKLSRNAERNTAHCALWEVAQKEGDGIEEQKQREIIHSLLDQALDTRAEVLQLVKKFQSL